MKKNTKGAIALGAAALLLAGGAGTYAAWSDEATIGGGDVNSGQLRITENEGGQWTWAGGGVFDPESDLIVPGDVIEYTADYQLAVEGTNLVAVLTPSLGGVTGDLEQHLNVVADSNTGGIDLENITEENDEDIVSVTVSIEFDPGTSDQDGMGQSATLEGSTITLEQVLASNGNGNGEGEED